MTNIIADICLYGTRQTGYGFLAEYISGTERVIVGNSTPVEGRCLVEATTMAVINLPYEVRTSRPGQIRVFNPDGFIVAVLHVAAGGEISNVDEFQKLIDADLA